MNTLVPMTRLFDAAFNNYSDSCRFEAPKKSSVPRADILESEKEFMITLDLPGVRSDDLDLSIEDQTLLVKAEYKSTVPEGFASNRTERAPESQFSRTFKIGNSIDSENISAKLEDGVLSILLPKTERSLPRKIQVT